MAFPRRSPTSVSVCGCVNEITHNSLIYFILGFILSSLFSHFFVLSFFFWYLFPFLTIGCRKRANKNRIHSFTKCQSYGHRTHRHITNIIHRHKFKNMSHTHKPYSHDKMPPRNGYKLTETVNSTTKPILFFFVVFIFLFAFSVCLLSLKKNCTKCRCRHTCDDPDVCVKNRQTDGKKSEQKTHAKMKQLHAVTVLCRLNSALTISIWRIEGKKETVRTTSLKHTQHTETGEHTAHTVECREGL